MRKILKNLSISILLTVGASPAYTQTAPVPLSTPAAQAVAEIAAAASQPVAASADYVLSPDDTVQMTVFREPDLSTISIISRDGAVQLPLLNDVKVAGLTIRDAREKIRKLYDADFLVGPQVTLSITTFAERTFSVMGQVFKPGNYQIKGGQNIGIIEAIALAGGFTRTASSKVTVKRRAGDGEQTININTKDNKATFIVRPGDVITVGESWF